MPKGGKHYDDEDYDYDDDDDYYDDDEYEEYDVKPAAKPAPKAAPPPPSKVAKVVSQPAKAAPKQGVQMAQAKAAGKFPTAPQGQAKPAAFSGPSPDDQVRAAQQRGGLSGAQEAQLSAALDSARVTPAPAAAGPPYRPFSEYRMSEDLAMECAIAASGEDQDAGGKSHVHLVVMGHVDAGKSTLMGRLMRDLGAVDARKVAKNEREAAAMGKGSFSWAWVLDERPEERARGVTIDVAVAKFETPGRRVTLLDAPGHRDFVPNAIAGAAQADAAFLLVDGSVGGFEAGFQESASTGFGSDALVTSGQTREHAQLARSLGIEQLAVVVSKLDTCGFDADRYAFIRGQMDPYLRGLGYREVQWLIAVGPQGINLLEPPTAVPQLAWFKGPTVVQAIDHFKPRDRLVAAPLRLCVSETIRTHSLGLGVSGKIEAGTLKPRMKVVLMPGRHEATVKAIEVGGKPVDLARAGDTADVGLQGIEPEVISMGSVLCLPDFPIRRVKRCLCQVVIMDPPVPVLKGQGGALQAHASRVGAVVTSLVRLVDPKSGSILHERPRCLLKGQAAVVEITIADGCCLDLYSECRGLGRIVLRDTGRTVLAGVVTEVLEWL